MILKILDLKSKCSRNIMHIAIEENMKIIFTQKKTQRRKTILKNLLPEIVQPAARFLQENVQQLAPECSGT